MFVDEWGSELGEIKYRASFCTRKKQQNEKEKTVLDFPLVDILVQIYRIALDEYQYPLKGRIHGLLEKYKKECCPTFDCSVDQLVEKGWIESVYGLDYVIVKHDTDIGKDILIERYDDRESKEIIEFILWADEQKLETGMSIQMDRVLSLLESWRSVCPEVPELTWFERKNYLFPIGEIVYISCENEYCEYIGMAMAHLWDELCLKPDYAELAEKWELLAYQTRVSPKVIAYVKNDCNNENKNKLITRLWRRILNECKYVDKKIEINKSVNILKMSSSWSIVSSEDVLRNNLGDSNRAFSRHNSTLIEETKRWSYARDWGDFFFLNSVLCNQGSLSEEDRLHLFTIVLAYAESGRIDNISLLFTSEVILEMMLHKETFFYGAMLIVKDANAFSGQNSVYFSYVISIFDKVLDLYVRKTEKPVTKDMLDVLLYLVDSNKRTNKPDTPDNPYFMLYKKLINLFFSSKYITFCVTGLAAYFEEMFSNKVTDVDFGRYFSLLMHVTDRLLVSGVRCYTKETDLVVDLANQSLLHLMEKSNNSCRFIDTDCLTKEICGEIYDRYLLNLSVKRKESRLGFNLNLDDRSELSYRI